MEKHTDDSPIPAVWAAFIFAAVFVSVCVLACGCSRPEPTPRVKLIREVERIEKIEKIETGKRR